MLNADSAARHVKEMINRGILIRNGKWQCEHQL